MSPRGGVSDTAAPEAANAARLQGRRKGDTVTGPSLMLPQGIRLQARGHGADERFYGVEVTDGRVGWMSGPMTEVQCRAWLAEGKMGPADIERLIATARAERRV
jgi:hypothetical protein